MQKCFGPAQHGVDIPSPSRCRALSGGTPSSFWALFDAVAFHLQKTRPSSTVQIGAAYTAVSSCDCSPLRLNV